MPFTSLGLGDDLLAAVADQGYHTPSPIQAQAIPAVLSGRDVMAAAQTGTGKTAAFLIAAYQRVLTQSGSKTHADNDSKKVGQPQIFILAPTRELAVQIAKDAEELGKHTGLRIALAFGGTGYEQQRRTIAAGIDLLIGTPGRIIDYFKQGVFKLDEVQVAVGVEVGADPCAARARCAGELDAAESPVLALEEDLIRLRIARVRSPLVRLGVDVAVEDEEVQPPVQIEV